MFLLQDGTDCGWVKDVVLVRTKSAKYKFSNNDVSENRAILSFSQFYIVVISYRRFGANSGSQLRFFYSQTLKTGPIDCPETSLRNHHYSLRNNPVERSSHLPHGGSLKSRSDVFVHP